MKVGVVGQEGDGREPDGGRDSGGQEGQMAMEGGDGRRTRWHFLGVVGKEGGRDRSFR